MDFSLNRFRVFVTVKAALENCLSTEAEDAGVDKKSLTIMAKPGKTLSFLFHHSKISSELSARGSDRYLSIS